MAPQEDASLHESWRDTLGGSGAYPVQPATPFPHVGAMFGRFRLEAELGRGAFAVVFRATDAESDKPVALKLLFKPTARRWARFLREGEVVARFDHPHIIRLYDIGEYGGHAYHALEFIEGQPLDEMAPLPPSRAASIALDLSRATQYAHDHGILHRDIKPNNVLVRPVDNPCLIDFGVARDQEENARLTSTGETVGTLQFVAPEQLVDSKRVGPPCDVYGIGATLYYLLTGETLLPIEAGPLAVFSTRPPMPSVYEPSVPEELDTICARAVEIRAADRYQTAKELADALEAYLEAARPKPELPRWVVPTAGGVAVLLVALLIGLFAVGDTPTPEPPLPPVDPLPAANVDDDPRTPWVRSLIGEARKQARARESYQAPLMTLKRARRAAEDNTILRAEVAFEKAYYLMRRGRYREATEGFQASYPPSLKSRAALMLGICLRAQGRDDEAQVAFKELWESDPQVVSGMVAGAFVAIADGQQAEAGTRCEGAIQADEDAPYARYVRATLLSRRAPELALADLERARMIVPDEPLFLAAWGRLAARHTPTEDGETGGAARAMGDAIALTEPNPDPGLLEAWAILKAREHVTVGAGLHDASALEELLEQVERVVEANPRSAEALLWRGLLKFVRRKAAGGGVHGDQAFMEDPKAEEDWRAARALNPQGFPELCAGLPPGLVEAIGAAVGQ